MQALKRILILYKNSPSPAETARSLRLWLGARGVESEMLSADVELMPLRASAAASDAVLVLGGDGSIIEASHMLLGENIPIIGNFLAEVIHAIEERM